MAYCWVIPGLSGPGKTDDIEIEKKKSTAEVH